MTCHRPFDVNVVVQRRRRQRTNFPPSRSRRRKSNDRSAKSVDCGHSFAVKWCRVCMNKCAFFFITSQHGEKSPLLLLKICPFLLHFLSVRRRRKRKRKNQTNPDELLGVVLLRPKIIENNDKKRLEPRSGKSGSVTVRFVLRSFFSLCFEYTTDRCFLSLFWYRPLKNYSAEIPTDSILPIRRDGQLRRVLGGLL